MKTIKTNRIPIRFVPPMKTAVKILHSQCFSSSTCLAEASREGRSSSIERASHLRNWLIPAKAQTAGGGGGRGGEGLGPRFLSRAAASVICLIFVSSWLRAAETGQTFATPEAAIKALGEAANAQDRKELRSLFGLATDELVAADQVQAKNDLQDFAESFNKTNHLVRVSDDRFVLEVGPSAFPFPIPLAKQNGKWFFDTDAGKEELLNRRIGRNELDVLESVRAYVDAQRDYARKDRDGDGVLEYAQRLGSSDGNQDGLYWEPQFDGDMSPLGPLVAEARQEGYRKSTNEGPQAFHGYYFKILKAQGKNAPGGKYDYVINGNMIGGFALIAWPANYGESGIMTFIVNQQGRVYQKDLGPKTTKLAERMKSYDPDATWKPSPD